MSLRDNKIDSLSTNNHNMRGRRVINAAASVDSTDYIIKKELTDALDEKFGTPGIYTKVTTDSQGRVIRGTDATPEDIGALAVSQHDKFYSSRSTSITTVTVPNLAAGRYLVCISVGATTSGTGNVVWTFSWTSGGVTRTITSAGLALTVGMLTSNYNATQAVNIDVGTSFTYATTYTATGSYEFSFTLTKL